MELTNPKTGEKRVFFGSEVLDAVNAGWEAPAGATVNVDVGGLGGDPSAMDPRLAAQEAGALSQRSQSAAPVDSGQREGYMEDKYGGVLPTIAAFGEGALDTASFGLYSGAHDLFLGDSFDREARARQNPNAHLAGVVAGIIPSFAAGGTGALGAAARVTPTGRLAAWTAKGATAGNRAARMAVEGAAYGAGTGVSNLIISDEPLTAEAVWSELGLPTLIGAGIGGAGGVVAGVAERGAGALAARRAAREAEGAADAAARLAKYEGRADAVRRDALTAEGKAYRAGKDVEEAAASLEVVSRDVVAAAVPRHADELATFDSKLDEVVGGMTSRDYDVAWPQVEARHKAISAAADEAYDRVASVGAGQPEAVAMTASRRKLDEAIAARAANVPELLTKFEDRVYKLHEAVNLPPPTAGAGTYTTPRLVNEELAPLHAAYKAAWKDGTVATVRRLRDQPLEASLAAGQARDDLMRALGPHAPASPAWDAVKGPGATDWAKMVGMLPEDFKATPSGEKLAGLWMASHAQDVKRAEGIGAASKALSDKRVVLDNAVETRTAKRAKDTLSRDELEAVARDLASGGGKAAKKDKGGLLRQMVTSYSRIKGGRALGLGVGGYMLAGMAGGSVFDQITGGAGLLALSTQAFRSRIATAAEKLLRGTAKVSKRVAPLAMLNDSDGPQGKDMYEAFEHRKRELLQAHPSVVAERLAPVRFSHLGVAVAAEAQTKRAVGFLIENMPRDPGTARRNGRSIYKPSESDLAKFARHYGAVQAGGAGIIEDFAEGQGSPEAGQVLREVFPEAARAFYEDFMHLLPVTKVPYDRRFQLSVMLDMAVDTLFLPDRTAGFDETWKQADEASQQMGGKPPPRPAQPQPMLAPQPMTAAQSLSQPAQPQG